MRVELRRLVDTCRHPIVIAANRGGVQAANDVDRFDRIRAVSDQVSAAQNSVVTCLFCTLDAGLEGFQVGVDVTEDEIAHGVLWLACDSRRSWLWPWSWRC